MDAAVIDPFPDDHWDEVPQFDIDRVGPYRSDDGRVVREDEARPSAAPSSSLRLYDDVEVMTLPPPEYIIDGILERRSKAAIVGQSGVYKTTLLADLLVAVATGQEWFGHRVLHRCSSVYVAAESGGFPARLAAAKRARKLSLNIPVGVYTFPGGIDLRDRRSVDTFVTFIEAQQPTAEIVAIDTYAAATPGAAETTSEDTTMAMAAAGVIGRALAATVILVHHTNAAGTRERGHSSMKGDLDTLLMLEEVDDVIEVKCDKQRNAAKFDTFKLKPVPDAAGSVVLRPAAHVLPSDALTQKQSAVLDVLREAGRDGVTKVQWKDLAKNLATERSFYKIADRLEAHGCLIRSGNYFIAKAVRP